MCSLNAPHRVTAFPSRRLSLGLFLWDLQSDIWKPIEGCGEKGNFFRKKTGRKISKKLLCVLLIQSQSYSTPLKKPFAKTVLEEFASDIWKAIDGYGEKDNIFRKKLERIFLRNCFVFC